ncbi:MAG: hydrolase 1, exosortase A system-associated [Gammaproteobacteria bacterium]|nr:hydrolase 1, exosortase A system-associated [Gammaproteobacteria bacterium]
MSGLQALVFPCGEAELVGVLHEGHAQTETGVLIVVGGPQYRVGSHRQFVHLARALAAAGYPVLRFDYSGMGDAGGAPRNFEQVDRDLKAAIDQLCAARPGLKRVVLWGLCDAASASLFYAWRDPRVTGLVLANPWARTAASEAEAYLKHYYWSRLTSREFWLKLLKGGLRLGDSLASLRGFLRQRQSAEPGVAAGENALSGSLPERMAQGWRRFPGPLLVLLSGDDLTAREFEDVAGGHTAWKGLLAEGRVRLERLPEANHTFSCQAWRDQVAGLTLDWLRTRFP